MSDAEPDPRPGARRAGEPFVSTQVQHESGRYVVVLDVVFPDGAVRHRLGSYHTRERAEFAARIVRATADRDHPPDPNG